MARKPGWPCAVLLVAGVLSLVLGGLALYARHAVLDQRAFADRRRRRCSQDEVRDEIAQRIADREIDADPGARRRAGRRSRRPSPRSSRARASRPSSTPGATALHESLFAGGAAGDGAGAARARRRSCAPRSRSTRRPRRRCCRPPIRSSSASAAAGSRARCARPRRWDATCRRWRRWACSSGWCCSSAAALRAPTLRLGLRRAALGLALAGGATVAATAIGRAIVLSTFDTSHGDAVVGTIWSAFLADLRLWGLIVGGARDRGRGGLRARGAGRVAARPRRGDGAARQRSPAGPRRRPRRARRAAAVDARGAARPRAGDASPACWSSAARPRSSDWPNGH